MWPKAIVSLLVFGILAARNVQSNHNAVNNLIAKRSQSQHVKRGSADITIDKGTWRVLKRSEIDQDPPPITVNPEVDNGLPNDATTTSTNQLPTLKPVITEVEAYMIVERVLSTMFQDSSDYGDLLYMIVREIPRDSLSTVITQLITELLKESETCRNRILIDVVSGGIHAFTDMESSLGDKENLRHIVEMFVTENPTTNLGRDVPIANFTHQLAQLIFKPIYDFTFNVVEPKIGFRSPVMFTQVREFLDSEPAPDFTLNDLLLHVGMLTIVSMQALGNVDCDVLTTPEVYSFFREEAEKHEQQFRLVLDTLATSGGIQQIDPALSQEEVDKLVEHLEIHYKQRTEPHFAYLNAFEDTGVDTMEQHLQDIAVGFFDRFLVYEVETSVIETLVKLVRVTVEEEIEKCSLFHGITVGSLDRDQLKLILKLVFERVLREGTDECIDTVLIRMLTGFDKYREYYINWDFVYFTDLFETLEVELEHLKPSTPRLAVLSFRLIKEMLGDHYITLIKTVEQIAGRSMSEMYYFELERLASPENLDMELEKFVEEVIRQALYAIEIDNLEECSLGSDVYTLVTQHMTAMLTTVTEYDENIIQAITKETLQLYDATELQTSSASIKSKLETLFTDEVGEITALRDRLRSEGQYGLMDEIIDVTVEIVLDVLPAEEADTAQNGR